MDDLGKFNETRKVVGDFLSKMYAARENGLKKICPVDEASLQSFTTKYSMLDDMDTRELEQHMLRTLYIQHSWANATLAVSSILDIQNHGWLKTGNFELKWFEGTEMPELATYIIIQPQEEEDVIDNESCHLECHENIDDDDDSDNDVYDEDDIDNGDSDDEANGDDDDI
ncbi:hypothetical protein JTB14_009671 [Gonioctena quinquepunctata]|nr:hypothetical protein JTB14_009671 [Gonioctena quinquepunctata]